MATMYKCATCGLEAWYHAKAPCVSCGGQVELTARSHAYNVARSKAQSERRGTSKAMKRAKTAARTTRSRFVLGLAQVPWDHVWAGLDPLPCGAYPERFRQTAGRATSTPARSCET